VTASELEVAKVFFELVSTLSIVIGGVWAVVQIRTGERDRRAEWLWRLSSEFYANKDFEKLRRLLDDPSWTKWSEISPDRLDDYLHFLEMVAMLSDTGQFERKYVHAVFGYWVERVAAKEGAPAYLKKYGYEHLLAWVEKREYTPPLPEPKPYPKPPSVGFCQSKHTPCSTGEPCGGACPDGISRRGVS
jgi:hypothetical protein